MNLLMISGDRSVLQGKKSAFFYTLQELSKYFDQIDIICPHTHVADNYAKLIPKNVQFHSPKWLPKVFQWMYIVREGRKLYKEASHFERMTVHEYPPFFNGFGAKCLHFFTGVPYVLEIHHIVGWPKAASISELVGKILSRFWLPISASRASAVRIVSNEINAVLQNWKIPREKIEIISSFYLDHDALKPDLSIAKEFDVVFCARLVANKGLFEFLEAVSRLSGIKALVIGDGPLRCSAERLAKHLGIAGRVRFTGWLQEKEDVYRAIQSARIFVMNSKSEGGPRILLEAMALGMPCIATEVGVVPQLNARETKMLYITTGHSDDLAQKIQNLLSNPSVIDDTGKTRDSILFLFERSSTVETYARMLRDIASSSSSISSISSIPS